MELLDAKSNHGFVDLSTRAPQQGGGAATTGARPTGGGDSCAAGACSDDYRSEMIAATARLKQALEYLSAPNIRDIRNTQDTHTLVPAISWGDARVILQPNF